MNNTPLISIIIPVYNVLPWLDQCVQSVMTQTYQNLDIILVDDGSTDGSGQRCDAWQKKDVRIRVIHQSNGGLSAARNTGINAAKGAYLFFLDSDDYLCPACIDQLQHLAETANADVAVCGYSTFKEENKRKPSHLTYRSPALSPICRKNDGKTSGTRGCSTAHSQSADGIEIFSSNEFRRRLLYQQGISTSAWGKLYRRVLFDTIRFEAGRLFEDVVPIYQAASLARRAVVTTTPLYVYRVRKGSITKNAFDLRQLDYVRNCRKLRRLVKEKSPALLKGAQNRLVWSEIYVIVHAGKGELPAETEEKLWRHVEKHRAEMLRDPDTTSRVKAVLLLSFFGKDALRAAFQIGRNI